MRARIATPKPARVRTRGGRVRPGPCDEAKRNVEPRPKKPVPEHSTFRRVAVFVPLSELTL